MIVKRALRNAATFLVLATGMAQAQTVPSPAASTCLACHGTGDAKKAFPDLSQFDAAMIVESMAQFRSGARGGTIMNRIAKGYSDDESRAIAQELVAALHAGAPR